MAQSIGVKIGIEGEKEYRDQIKNINQQMKTLDSQLQLTTSEMGKNATEQQKATERAKTLRQQIALQEQALKENADMLAQYREKTGESSTETQKYQDKVNKAKIALEKMKTELAEATAKSKTMGESLKTAGDKIEKAGSKITKVGNGLTKYVSAPLLGLGVASFKMASDLQENINKTEVAFGDASDTVMEWSETTIENFGLAQSTALEMASQFGDMATSMGLTTDEASDMSRSLVGLSADLASFKNISSDEAMTALNGIFTGETESLKRLGVVMTEATLKEYAMSKGIKKNYKEMTQAEKVNLRYQYVMEMTTNAQGDFLRTSDGSANQMRMVQERVKQLGAEFGEKLLPIGEKLLHFVNDLLDGFSNLDDSTQQTIIQTGLFAIALGPVISTVGNTVKGVGNLTRGLGTLADKMSLLSSSLSGTSAGVGLLGQTLAIGAPFALAFGGAMLSIGDSIGKVSQPAKDLAQAFAETMPNFEEYEDYINSASSALSNFSIESTSAGQHIGEYDEEISNSIENIHTIMAVASEQSRQFTEAEWEEIQNLLGAVEEYTNKKIEAYEEQQRVVASMAEMEVEMTKERSAELIKSAQETRDQTIAIANQKYQSVLTEAETMFSAGEIEKEAYDKMRQEATDNYDEMVAKANKAYSDTNAIISEKFLEQNVLTDENVKQWQDYFKALEMEQADNEEAYSHYLDEVRKGSIDYNSAMTKLKDSEENIARSRGDIMREMIKQGKDGWNEQTQDTVQYWLTMASDVEMYGGKVSKKEEDFVQEFARIMGVIPEDMQDTAKDAMNGFAQEMKDNQPTLFQRASTIANGIINTLNSVFDIHSPSKVMKRIAGNVWSGFELGTEKEQFKLNQQAYNVASGINESFSRSFAMARTAQFSSPVATARTRTGIQENAVGALQQALQGVKIVLDDEVAGHFVEKTVTNIVYN